MTKDTHQQLARNSTTSRNDNEPLFDMKTLREELHHHDTGRRQFARNAMYWLDRLASHRAISAGVPSEKVWDDIFDAKLFQADLQSLDETRCDLAHRVLVAVSAVAAIREVDESTEPTSIDIRVRAMAHRINAREKANEIACADGEAPRAYTLN